MPRPLSQAAVLPQAEGAAQAPPPAAEPQQRILRAAPQRQSIPPGLTLYSIGEPTDEEQLYVEFINRARRDPPGEAERLRSTTDPDIVTQYQNFAVDLSLMASQVAAIPPAPPLSINAQLTAAARVHSADMLANAFQGHTGTDGSTFGTRATAQGYAWDSIAENVFASASSVWQGHAAFEVDWGKGGVGGMQTPPGHRDTIHSLSQREIGVGVLKGRNGLAGPQVVTQDFGNRPGLNPFITGVVYYELNGNGFYDLDEGLGGAVVLAEGSGSYAVTASSGGYSVPVPAHATYRVTIRVAGAADIQKQVAVGDESVKVDHALSYSPPVIAGPDQPVVNENNSYTFAVVPGAIGYQWKQSRLRSNPAPEGAENGLAGLTATTSPGYSVIDSTIKATGQNAFRFAHPKSETSNAPPEDQFLLLTRSFRAGPAGQLTFARRLSWASPQQVARAQITIDAGLTWQDLWSQAGTDDAGDTQFSTQAVSLAPFAGMQFSLRFVYDHIGGGFFPQTDPGVGFYLDDIALTGVDELSGDLLSDLPAETQFSLVPVEPGALLLQVRPKLVNRFLPWGPGKVVTARAGSGVQVRILSVQRLGNGNLQFEFSAANIGAATVEVQSAAQVTGAWGREDGASVRPAGAGTFIAVVPPATAPQRYYRIVVN